MENLTQETIKMSQTVQVAEQPAEQPAELAITASPTGDEQDTTTEINQSDEEVLTVLTVLDPSTSATPPTSDTDTRSDPNISPPQPSSPCRSFGGYSSELDWGQDPEPSDKEPDSGSGSDDDFIDSEFADMVSPQEAKIVSKDTGNFITITNFDPAGLVPGDELEADGLSLTAYHRGEPVYFKTKG